MGKYAPRFKLGFCIMSGLSVLQFAMIFVLRYFVNREGTKQKQEADILDYNTQQTGTLQDRDKTELKDDRLVRVHTSNRESAREK